MALVSLVKQSPTSTLFCFAHSNSFSPEEVAIVRSSADALFEASRPIDIELS